MTVPPDIVFLQNIFKKILTKYLQNFDRFSKFSKKGWMEQMRLLNLIQVCKRPRLSSGKVINETIYRITYSLILGSKFRSLLNWNQSRDENSSSPSSPSSPSPSPSSPYPGILSLCTWHSSSCPPASRGWPKWLFSFWIEFPSSFFEISSVFLKGETPNTGGGFAAYEWVHRIS